MMVFILFGSVNYAIAVIVRTLYFSLIFMVEATVIIILIIRQVIILKVIYPNENRKGTLLDEKFDCMFLFLSQFGFAI